MPIRLPNLKTQTQAPGNSTFLADNFTRANTAFNNTPGNTDVGNGWVDEEGGVYRINNNQLEIRLDGINGNQFNRDRLRSPQPASLSNVIEIIYPPNRVTADLGVFCREQSNQGDCYMAELRPDGLVSLYTLISGTATAFNASTMDSFNAALSYTLYMSCDPSIGVSGNTTFTVEVRETISGNTTWSGTAFDTSATLQGPGSCGILAWGNASGSFILDAAGANVLSHPVPRIIAPIGDSIYVNKADSSQGPEFIASPDILPQTICDLLIGATGHYTTYNNQAISGKTSTDWSPSGTILAPALASIATSVATGQQVVIPLRLGTNDSRAAILTTKAVYKANMIAIVTAAAAVAPVVLHYPIGFQPGVSGGIWNGAGVSLINQYCQAIDEICAMGINNVFQGDRTTNYPNQRNILSFTQANGDGHPNFRGYEALAFKDALALGNAMNWLNGIHNN